MSVAARGGGVRRAPGSALRGVPGPLQPDPSRLCFPEDAGTRGIVLWTETWRPPAPPSPPPSPWLPKESPQTPQEREEAEGAGREV